MRYSKIVLLSALLLSLAAWTNAHAQTVTHTFNVSWTDNSNNEEGFYIYRVGVTARIGQVGVNVTKFSETVTGTAGQQVCYQVSAFNHQFTDGTGNIQESAKSLQGCGTIPVPSQPAPTAPSGVQISGVTSSSITLRWTDNADNETSQEIMLSQSTPKRTWIIPVAANLIEYRATGLRKNTQYTGKVRAINESGASAWSNQASATTPRR